MTKEELELLKNLFNKAIETDCLDCRNKEGDLIVPYWNFLENVPKDIFCIRFEDF